MTGRLLVVAALLLTSLTRIAAAAEVPEHKSKNAQKALIVLGAIGIDSTDVKEFVGTIDTRVDHGYFKLTETKVAGGTLTLHYKFQKNEDSMFVSKSGGGLNRLELRYAPDDSHFEAIARPDRFMIGYRFQF